MVQIDVPICIGLGSVFAHAVRERLAAGDSAAYDAALNKALCFNLFFNVWVPVYFLFIEFGFQTSHMWWHADSVSAYPWLTPAFIVLLVLCTIVGFRIGAALVQAGRARANRWFFSAMFGLSFLWFAAQPRRTLTLGTYREWLAGQTRWMWQDGSFITFVAVVVVVWSLGLTYFYRSLRPGAESASSPADRA